MRGIVKPALQFPAEPLKTETSRTPVPIPRSLANVLAEHAAGREYVLTGEAGPSGWQVGPWTLDRAFAAARGRVEGLPDGFRFHDLRHFYASLLIASGANIKIVQARLRHASATTTLDTYSHLFPDSDESTRTAIEHVLSARLSV
jgi:integrase